MISNKINSIILLLFLIIFAVTCVIGNATNILYLLFVLFVYSYIYSILHIQKYLGLVLFFSCFFTFLLGRLFLPIILGENYISSNFYTSYSFSEDTLKHVYISLFLSVYFIFLTYFLIQRNQSLIITPHFNNKSINIYRIRIIAKNFVYISIPFMCLVIWDKIKYVLKYGYSQIFMEYETSLPSVVIIFSILFGYMVFLYLATLPNKNESKNIIFLYIIISTLNLLAGDREETMLSILVIVFYYSLRNRMDVDNIIWITKKHYILLVSLVPFIIVLFFLISYLRNDSEVDKDDLLFLLAGFFYQQGASLNVIACTYDSFNLLPQGKLYSLGAIFDYFKNNHISKLLFGTESYAIGSVDLAKKGNSLDPALTYIEDSTFYFNGGGMGSCFIAEAWHDFGYIGIILFSILYGYVLANISKWCAKNVWLAVISLIFLKFLMFAPRARATTFITSAFSVSFWPIALFIYLFSINNNKRRI